MYCVQLVQLEAEADEAEAVGRDGRRCPGLQMPCEAAEEEAAEARVSASRTFMM